MLAPMLFRAKQGHIASGGDARERRCDIPMDARAECRESAVLHNFAAAPSFDDGSMTDA
jgi:hypothetical protein